MWQIIHWEIDPDKSRHSTKQAHMQGGLWNQYTDSIEGKNLMKIYTRNKDKIRHGQNNNTKCNKYTPHICHRATRSMKILCKQIIG